MFDFVVAHNDSKLHSGGEVCDRLFVAVACSVEYRGRVTVETLRTGLAPAHHLLPF